MLLPLRESVQSSWRANWQEGGNGKKESEREEKSKRKEMVFNKQAALYGNVMNTVDKKRERQKL